MCIVSFCIGNNYRDLTAASPPAGGSALTDAPVVSFTTLPLRATQHTIRQLADEGCSSSSIERPALITKAASLDTHKSICKSRAGQCHISNVQAAALVPTDIYKFGF